MDDNEDESMIHLFADREPEPIDERGVASRLGQGRLKHVELRQLAIQEFVRNRRLRLSKVDTAHNGSDIMTMYFAQKLFDYRRERLGMIMMSGAGRVGGTPSPRTVGRDGSEAHSLVGQPAVVARSRDWLVVGEHVGRAGGIQRGRL